MRVIDHFNQSDRIVIAKCPKCHRLIDCDELISHRGLYSVTLTCPYCNYSQKKYYLIGYPDFPDWRDDEVEALLDIQTEEEENDNSD